MSIYHARYDIAKEGGLVVAIQKACAYDPTHETLLLAGELLAIGSRETGYLWGSHYGKFHDWAILGDVGHGHGVFQIDDRSHSDFTSTNDWKDPYLCAMKAIEIYTEGKIEVDKLLEDITNKPDEDNLKNMYYSAYNVGAKYAVLGWTKYNDPSKFTTGHNYGKDVLSQVSIYSNILETDNGQTSDTQT